jgi:hypothetical protein
MLSLCCRYNDVVFVNRSSSVLSSSFVYKAIRKIGALTRGFMNITSPNVNRNVSEMLHLPTCARAQFKEYGLVFFFFIRAFLPTQNTANIKPQFFLEIHLFSCFLVCLSFIFLFILPLLSSAFSSFHCLFHFLLLPNFFPSPFLTPSRLLA